MHCPNCGSFLQENARFCSCCGSEQTASPRGGHLVPLLILAGLSLCGILVFFLS